MRKPQSGWSYPERSEGPAPMAGSQRAPLAQGSMGLDTPSRVRTEPQASSLERSDSPKGKAA